VHKTKGAKPFNTHPNNWISLKLAETIQKKKKERKKGEKR
jgi:hypothetical protein